MRKTAGGLRLASSTITLITSAGNVRIQVTVDNSTKSIILENALHVPDLRTNLLSMSKLTSNGNDAIFTKKRVIIKRKGGGPKVLEGTRNGKSILLK